MNRPQLILLISGTTLIVVGIGLVIAQVFIQVDAPEVTFPTRSLGIDAPSASATVETTYVGLVIIVIGAVLEIVAYVGGRPWKLGSKSGKNPLNSLS